MQRYPPVFITSQLDGQGETGVETHFRDFTAYLRGMGRTVEFIGPREAHQRYLPLRLLNGILGRSIRLHAEAAYTGLRWLSFHSTHWELRKRLHGLTEWCVYAQDPVTARAALDLRRAPGQRVVLAVHYNISQADEMARRGNLPYGGRLYRRIRQQEASVLGRVNLAIAFSAYMREIMVELGGAMDKIVVIPNTAGLPPPPLRPIEGDLIAIGSLEPRKNQAFLLQVLAEANRLGYRYQLNVVGSGESRLALEALTHELGLAGQVHFLGRIDQASSLLTGHKLLVHSALIENMPITLIEALASGTPILAPPVGGIPEIVRDGVEGFHWNLSDVPGSARILIKLMNDPVLRKSMSEAGRSRFLANFESSAVLTSLARAVYG